VAPDVISEYTPWQKQFYWPGKASKADVRQVADQLGLNHP
jgi:hypothetical protein